jgi:lysozyme family protein
MKDNYERILAFILLREGAKATNIKGDRGGLTAAYGLTLKTMKTLKLDLDKDGDVDEQDVKLVTKEVIDAAFRWYFWDLIDGDNLPAGIDLILADISWNSGVGKVKQFIREGFAKDIYELTERRKRFYQYQADFVEGQDKFIKGWLVRADEALKEAEQMRG